MSKILENKDTIPTLEMILTLKEWDNMIVKMKSHEKITIEFPSKGMNVTLECDWT
jgi:serine protease inhibitor